MATSEVGQEHGGQHHKPTNVKFSVKSRHHLALIFVSAWLVLFQHANSQEFRVGMARAKITPEESGWLGGYGHRKQPAEGVAADLWARALALEDKLGHRRVLVNADIHIFTRRLHQAIVEAARNRFGLEQGEVMLIATHTHSGPALPEGFDPVISWGLDERELRKLHAAADRTRWLAHYRGSSRHGCRSGMQRPGSA